MEDGKKVVFYHDELHDEFAGDHIEAKKIDEHYRYVREGFFGTLLHAFWYRIIATPLAFCYLKLHFGHRIIGKEKLKEAGGDGYFLYGNHTHNLADALVPTMIATPRDAFVIVHANNVSMPVLGRITPYLGALPLPDDAAAGKHFLAAVRHHVTKKRCVMIYPEAHIWPYYTDIRPFTDASFRYPVNCEKPVYCLTNTYQKRKCRETPRLVTYLDGPFYPDAALSKKERQKALRDQVYRTMKERAKENTVCLITYIRASGQEDEGHTI